MLQSVCCFKQRSVNPKLQICTETVQLVEFRTQTVLAGKNNNWYLAHSDFLVINTDYSSTCLLSVCHVAMSKNNLVWYTETPKFMVYQDRIIIQICTQPVRFFPNLYPAGIISIIILIDGAGYSEGVYTAPGGPWFSEYPAPVSNFTLKEFSNVNQTLHGLITSQMMPKPASKVSNYQFPNFFHYYWT